MLKTSVTSWCDAVERCREIQSQHGVSSDRQSGYWIDARVNAMDVAERCICVRYAGRIVCEVI